MQVSKIKLSFCRGSLGEWALAFGSDFLHVFVRLGYHFVAGGVGTRLCNY